MEDNQGRGCRSDDWDGYREKRLVPPLDVLHDLLLLGQRYVGVGIDLHFIKPFHMVSRCFYLAVLPCLLRIKRQVRSTNVSIFATQKNCKVQTVAPANPRALHSQNGKLIDLVEVYNCNVLHYSYNLVASTSTR